MRGLLLLCAFSTLAAMTAATGLAWAEETQAIGKEVPDGPAVTKPSPHKPASFTEGSGYEWRGVFRVEGQGAKKAVYLCDPMDIARRIRLSPSWADFVLRNWRRYVNREMEGYSRTATVPLDFYLLLDPKK